MKQLNVTLANLRYMYVRILHCIKAVNSFCTNYQTTPCINCRSRAHTNMYCINIYCTCTYVQGLIQGGWMGWLLASMCSTCIQRDGSKAHSSASKYTQIHFSVNFSSVLVQVLHKCMYMCTYMYVQMHVSYIPTFRPVWVRFDGYLGGVLRGGGPGGGGRGGRSCPIH